MRICERHYGLLFQRLPFSNKHYFKRCLPPHHTQPIPTSCSPTTTTQHHTLCVYGEFIPLYSCLHTLRERYKSQNCDIGSTTTTQ